jgi:hypothetical protein
VLALARSGIDISAYRSVVPQLGGHHRLLFQVRADSQRHQVGKWGFRPFHPFILRETQLAHVIGVPGRVQPLVGSISNCRSMSSFQWSNRPGSG